MRRSFPALLRELESLRFVHDPASAKRKEEILAAAVPLRATGPALLLRFHEILCFLRAYPDSAPVLSRTARLLREFSRRPDLRRFRGELADTGIAGTRTYYAFYWFTAAWLQKRCGDRLFLDWSGFPRTSRDRLWKFLTLLVPYTETLAVEETGLETRDLIELLKGPDETDASFLIRRFHGLDAGPFVREAVYEDLDPPLILEPGPRTPSRTLAHHPRPVSFQREPLRTGRPVLPDAILVPPSEVSEIPVTEARKLIDLARGTMVNRHRDLDIFVHADPHDALRVDCGEGLEFVSFGAIPERRLMLDAVYGFLTMKNGVPLGYVLSNALFASAGIAYNVFETFRGGESGYIYGRVLAMIHRLFGADALFIDPYQLGHDNDEGLRSGAWWFYYKLGFRPHDPGVKRLLGKELSRRKRNPGHRTSRSVLNALAAENMYYFLGSRREEMLGKIDLGEIGAHVSGYLARRFGGDRERGVRVLAEEAAELTGASLRSLTRGERLAWNRWSPLLLSIPGVARWPGKDLRKAGEVMAAKGGRRESEFVRLFDRHRRLRSAVAAIGLGR